MKITLDIPDDSAMLEDIQARYEEYCDEALTVNIDLNPVTLEAVILDLIEIGLGET